MIERCTKDSPVNRLTNGRGYTLVEMLVGMVILLMVIAGALSFFIFQSTEGFESFRLKRVDEAVGLAQSVIARDVLEAGFGLGDHPELAMHIVQDTSPVSVDGMPAIRDQLYLSYSGYLTMESATPAATGSFASAVRRNTVFLDSMTDYQGFLTYGGSDQFTLRYCPKLTGTTFVNNVGGVIALDSAGTVTVKDVLYNDSITTCADESLQGYLSCTFKVQSGLATNQWIAPAVSYRVADQTVQGKQIGTLWRNRGGDATPAGMPFLGGEHYFRVIGLEVDYQFADATWAKAWNAGANQTPATLKLVRVRLTYQTRGKAAKWGPRHVRTIIVSPRNLVLGNS